MLQLIFRKLLYKMYKYRGFLIICIFCILCCHECYVVKSVSTGVVFITCTYVFMFWGFSDLCLSFSICFSSMFTNVTWFSPLILSMLCFVQFRQVVQGYQSKRRLRLNYKVRCFVFQLIWHFRDKWGLALGPHKVKLCSCVT